jgi:hypothetical protein
MQMTHVIINFRRHLKRRNYSLHTVKYYLNISSVRLTIE